MDMLNTKIGQNIAQDKSSIVTDKTFVTNNMLGLTGGVSTFAKGENNFTFQQVKNLEKSQTNLTNPTAVDEQKKLKANILNADKVSREEIVDFSQSFNETLGRVGEVLQTNGTKISFDLINMDDNAGQPIVIVTDKESGNVIRQIPSEEVLKFAERLQEFEAALNADTSNKGILFDRQV